MSDNRVGSIVNDDSRLRRDATLLLAVSDERSAIPRPRLAGQLHSATELSVPSLHPRQVDAVPDHVPSKNKTRSQEEAEVSVIESGRGRSPRKRSSSWLRGIKAEPRSALSQLLSRRKRLTHSCTPDAVSH